MRQRGAVVLSAHESDTPVFEVIYISGTSISGRRGGGCLSNTPGGRWGTHNNQFECDQRKNKSMRSPGCNGVAMGGEFDSTRMSHRRFIKRSESVGWRPGAESNHRHCDFQSSSLDFQNFYCRLHFPTEFASPTRTARAAAVICRYKSFLAWYLGLGLCRIPGFGDGCVFS
jgi:hypothetical protein